MHLPSIYCGGLIRMVEQNNNYLNMGQKSDSTGWGVMRGNTYNERRRIRTATIRRYWCPHAGSLMSYQGYEIYKAPLFPVIPVFVLPALEQIKLRKGIQKLHAVYERSPFTKRAVQWIIIWTTNITVRHGDAQSFQKSSSNIKFLDVRRVTWSKFHIEKQLILGATVNSLLVQVI